MTSSPCCINPVNTSTHFYRKGKKIIMSVHVVMRNGCIPSWAAQDEGTPCGPYKNTVGVRYGSVFERSSRVKKKRLAGGHYTSEEKRLGGSLLPGKDWMSAWRRSIS